MISRAVDNFLFDCGLERRDLHIRFKWRRRKYYVPAFSLLWWIAYIGGCVFAIYSFYAWYILMWLLFGG